MDYNNQAQEKEKIMEQQIHTHQLKNHHELIEEQCCVTEPENIRQLLLSRQRQGRMMIENARQLLDTLPVQMLDMPTYEFYRMIGA